MSYDIEIEEHEAHQVDQKQRLWDWLRKLKREQQTTPSNDSQKPDTPPQTPLRPGLGRRISRKVGVGIPRSTTFKRQQDEQRKNLQPTASPIQKPRELSRVRALSSSPKPPKKPKRETSAPDLGYHCDAFPTIESRIQRDDFANTNYDDLDQIPPPPPPPPMQRPDDLDDDGASQQSDGTSRTLDEEIRIELEQKWILNLSMHFRDKSPREKFFVTYAETPQKWRRVTVSCDYRNAEVDSLEADLQIMGSQREKSARVYEALRASLTDIQFYNTVTNLKLETRDERLHVHVTEDVNEIIQYPPTRAISHLPHIKKFRESELHFIEHMSGFVYKVNVGGNTWIKKEIPGPDSVDEFLYEVNALSNLTNASHVIELKGLVLSDDEACVKGLVIAYAEKNALIDIIYDNQSNLPWQRRERWARQIIKGLSEIHEAGFVQGDFTLSNIVIDGNDEAQIIDINRRGCPVGWEPPEIAKLIESGQRITMFIGLKSDLFQLGMVLWALAMEDDEPERQPRPLTLDNAAEDIPGYFRGLVESCLNADPVMRKSAQELLKEFPASVIVSEEDMDMMPELKPATQIPSTAVVTGSTSRAYAKIPEIEENAKADPSGEVTTSVPRRPKDSSGSPDNKGPKYTDMIAATAQQTEQEYTNGTSTSPGLLTAPVNTDTHSSMDPQTSSQAYSRDQSTLGGTSKSDTTQEAPVLPTKEQSPRRSIHSDSDHHNNFQDATEDFIPLTPTASASWDAITNGQDPYLIHPSTLEPLSPESENPPLLSLPAAPTNRRRSVYYADRHFSHVDSGIADTGDDPPTIPAPAPLPAHTLSTITASIPQDQTIRTKQVRYADAPPSPKPDTNTSPALNNDNHKSLPLSTTYPTQSIEHTDSGLADMHLVGIGEGLSFKERAHRSGITDDLAKMSLMGELSEGGSGGAGGLGGADGPGEQGEDNQSMEKGG
ncbi:uncharacterized protein KY384_003381 [Bacidia gigantensis]|uniref:uncharacterized protein n=1 Tax=Bacidia gigantensis TaxID=2732470 RepID=UPI001D058CEB|nr:uncharacterized protein KY384_003381 [Bacidia gigantensis]KAG8531749.1 hypothetical protein KY384_003381 [Bacidia gigantensis]